MIPYIGAPPNLEDDEGDEDADEKEPEVEEVEVSPRERLYNEFVLLNQVTLRNLIAAHIVQQ